MIKTIIADSTAKPDADDIELTKQQFLELLKIRSSSELFRLDTADEVMKRVDFRNVGEDQVEGLIVMSIDDGVSAGKSLDSANDAIVAIVNSTNESQSFKITGATGFALHTVQKSSADDTVKGASFAAETFTVPALTTAVFVQAQNGVVQGAGLPVDNSGKDVSSIPPYGQTTVYVRGDMNEWGASDDWAMSFVANGVYSVTGNLEANNYGFKFSDADWGTPNLGCNSLELASGSIALETADDGNCKLSVTEAGSYTFTLNAIHELDDNVEKAVVSVIKN